MSWITQVIAGRRWARDLTREMQEHLAEKTEELVASGMPPEEARLEAQRQFGNPLSLLEESREAWALRWLDSLVQDVRFARRQLGRNAGFTAVAVLTLALGIGANTAIFSVVYAVLLKPLPYAHPSQLLTVFESAPAKGDPVDSLSYQNFTECRRQNAVFREMAGYNAHDLTLTGADEPAVVHTVVVTPEVFSLLGVKPLAGRIFVARDGKRGAAPVVILSDTLWRSRFGANPRLVGRAISLDKRAFTVVGVMPATFQFPLDSASGDVWIPAVQDPVFGPFMSLPEARFLITIGRLKQGVSTQQAESAMATISARLARQFPAANSGFTLRVEPLRKEIEGDFTTALLVLLGAVALVLLIACGNIANLLLARATARSREMALRIALGAGRTRIIRQLITESVFLGLLGGIAGVLLAYWGVHALSSVLPPTLPRAGTIRVDGWVLVFALAVSVVATLIFGLAPALVASGSSPSAALRESAGRAGEGGGRRRALRLLATAEIALATVLLIAAGLLIRSFAALTSVNPGFNARHVITAEISLPRFQYSTPEKWSAFAAEFMSKISRQPGFQDSAIVIPLPITDRQVSLPFLIAGNPPLPRGTVQRANYASVSPGYFRVMEIPLVRGRWFNRHDSSMAAPVAIISQAFARRYFPDQNPLGRRLTFGFLKRENREIVGIVGDIRDTSLHQQPGPRFYAPYSQSPFWGSELVVRTSLDQSGVAGVIRAVVRKIDPDLPVTNIQTLPQVLSASVAQPRFRTILLGIFGAIALALATVGIFGVMSYSVSRRTHEMGIRMALGASPASVRRMILAESGRMLLMGLAAGVPIALALTRSLSSLLYSVRPADPLTFVTVAILLAAVTLLASYLPARRATKVHPAVALRHE